MLEPAALIITLAVAEKLPPTVDISLEIFRLRRLLHAGWVREHQSPGVPAKGKRLMQCQGVIVLS